MFAKAPVAGAVKTRMQPRLSELQSLALHEQLLNSIIDNLLQVSLAPIELWLTQSTDRLPAWPEMDRYYQCEGDLGQRLYHALQSALQRYHKVIVVGADCPFIDGEYLLNAFEELDKDKRIVLGPACDGGYVMMALKDLDFRIFTGIDWGSDKVLAQTCRQIECLGWSYRLLEPLPDIDRPEDLALLANHPALKAWSDVL